MDAENEAAATAGEQGEAALKAAHDGADCSKIQETLIEHPDCSHTVFVHLPVSSPTAVLAMYPCPSACLGENGEFLLPCESIQCNASNLEACYEPGKFVPVPDELSLPVYRSLGGGGDRDQAAVPAVELPPGTCVKNRNGSCTFVLWTAKFVKTDEEIATAIASMEYKDKSVYLLSLGKACFKSLTECMDSNGVDKSRIFAMDDKDPTQVDPGAATDFLHELYDNLRAENDMLVCIPGPNEDGELNMETAFSFCFHHPKGYPFYKHPALGLVHNMDPSRIGSEQEVEGDYYITSNVKLSIKFDNPTTGVPTDAVLHHPQEFLPYGEIPASDWDADTAFYRNLPPPAKDYTAWIQGCKALQEKGKTAYWEYFATVCAKMDLPPFDPRGLYTTNLVGRQLAKDATSFTRGKDMREDESGNILARQRAAREAAAAATDARSNKHKAHTPTLATDVQDGTEVDHYWRAESLLNQIPPNFVDMGLALCRGMDSEYVDMSTVGFARFKLHTMSLPHVKEFVRFIEQVVA
jgi:hypothetical protein